MENIFFEGYYHTSIARLKNSNPSVKGKLIQNMKLRNLISHNNLRRRLRQFRESYRNRIVVRNWIRLLKNAQSPKGRILISALRNKTWIEWAAYCAAVCRQMGFESTLLFKESEIKKFYPNPGPLNFWTGVKKIPGIKMINIEELPYEKAVFDSYFLSSNKKIIAALAYDHHIESADITDDLNTYGPQLKELTITAAMNGARIYKFLTQQKFHQFICYSGIISDTSLLLSGALDAGQDIVCVEGWAWRPGHMIYNFNAPALEYNINGWLKSFGDWNEKKESEMSGYFKFLDGVKQDNEWLENFYLVQRAKLTEDLPDTVSNFVQGNDKIFLLACNVIGDSSLLNRETIFKSHREFLRITIEYFKKNQQLKLIIRVHPAEEWNKGAVSLQMGAYSRKLCEGLSNILVIDANEKMNTFALVPFIRAGLIWITSAGADLVARGIPVISAAKPKYYGQGIVDEPVTIDEYFSLINRYAEHQEHTSPEQIQHAKEYLYIVFKGFSFEAQGRSYRANTCRLNDMPSQEDHDRFYRILLKTEQAPDRN